MIVATKSNVLSLLAGAVFLAACSDSSGKPTLQQSGSALSTLVSDVCSDDLDCGANERCLSSSCVCLPGFYVTQNNTCALKHQGWIPAPIDTLTESLGGGRASGCVSNTTDANNYCVPPSFGDGECAQTSQCAYVVDANLRQAGCHPLEHTCSASGCGSGSYVATDGLCYDKVASGSPGPSNIANPADGCVSGALENDDNCAPPELGAGDCWSDKQCSNTSTVKAATIGCMASHHCGAMACDPGYYVRANGTCALKHQGWIPAPLDTLTESLGGSRASGCVSHTTDANNYCVPPVLGAGDCTQASQCAEVFSQNTPVVACNTSTNTCSLCPAGYYRSINATCEAKVAGGSPVPNDTHSGNPMDGCVSGATNNLTCTMPTIAQSDCQTDAQCAGVVVADAATVGCASQTHLCAALTCNIQFYLAAGLCSSCTVCQSGQYEASACTLETDRVCAVYDASCATCDDASACTSCADGSYLQDGECITCTVCEPGERQVGACTATADTQCESCAPGTFTDQSNSMSCTACPAQTFSTGGALLCTPCEPGFYAQQGASACTQCEAGATFGGGACSLCAAGTYAEMGDATCTSCSPGTFANAGAANCTACVPGFFANTHRAEACSACATGSFAATAGATECTPCGNCDDGDACTSDVCSPVNGCVHEAVACGPSTSTDDPATEETVNGASGDEGPSNQEEGSPILQDTSGCAALSTQPDVWPALLAVVGLRRKLTRHRSR